MAGEAVRLGLAERVVAVVRQPRRSAPGQERGHEQEPERRDPEQEASSPHHRRMVPFRLGMRGLVRDTALFLVATLVLGTAANVLPGRRLAWWGKGQQPPREGLDFTFIDPGSAGALLASLPHVVFLDTRSSAQFWLAHVPGAQEVSYTDMDATLTPRRIQELRTADAVVIYGASDETDVEQLVAQELHRRGLPPPYVLAGGFGAWQGSGLPEEGRAR